MRRTIIGAAAWTYAARTQQNRVHDWLLLILSLQAEAAAVRIRQFIEGLEAQLGWTTQPGWSASTIEQPRFDVIRLLRQAPAITEFTQLDSSGREQVSVSRLAMETLPYVPDYSQHPKFTEAMAHRVYYGPVYFRRESEPYMTLFLAGTGRDAGVSAGEVNLQFIWDVVSQISVGPRGQVYIVDAEGRLIAHPDVSLVFRGTDMSRLPQVAAARAALMGERERAAIRGSTRPARTCAAARCLLPMRGSPRRAGCCSWSGQPRRPPRLHNNGAAQRGRAYARVARLPWSPGKQSLEIGRPFFVMREAKWVRTVV